MSQASVLGTGFIIGPAFALRPDRAIGPDVDFLHGADLAGLDLRGGLAHRVEGRVLVAHLRGDAMLAGEFAEAAGFPDGAGERLLAVDVLAHPHRLGGDHGVGVIGRADGHGVDAVAQLVEHLAVVGEFVVGLVGLRHAVEELGIDVAEGVDLAVAGDVLDVALALAADADAGDLHPLEGRLALGGLQRAGDPVAHARERRGLQEFAAIRLHFELHLDVRSSNDVIPDSSRKGHPVRHDFHRPFSIAGRREAVQIVGAGEFDAAPGSYYAGGIRSDYVSCRKSNGTGFAMKPRDAHASWLAVVGVVRRCWRLAAVVAGGGRAATDAAALVGPDRSARRADGRGRRWARLWRSISRTGRRRTTTCGCWRRRRSCRS